MQNKISKADVAKAKAMLAAYERQQKSRKRQFTRTVSKKEAEKSLSIVGHYAKQQGQRALKSGTAKAKSVAKNGAKKIKTWLKKK